MQLNGYSVISLIQIFFEIIVKKNILSTINFVMHFMQLLKMQIGEFSCFLNQLMYE